MLAVWLWRACGDVYLSGTCILCVRCGLERLQKGKCTFGQRDDVGRRFLIRSGGMLQMRFSKSMSSRHGRMSHGMQLPFDQTAEGPPGADMCDFGHETGKVIGPKLAMLYFFGIKNIARMPLK